MAATKPKKSRRHQPPKARREYPKGDALLGGVSTEDLRKMHAELSGRKKVG